MKTTETKRTKGTYTRAPEVKNYDTYSRYENELDVLDTDEDVILQYYITRDHQHTDIQNPRKRKEVKY